MPDAPPWLGRLRHRAVALIAGLGCSWGVPHAAMTASSPSPALRCHFSAQVLGPGRIELRFVLTNQGAHPLHVLAWGSPFEGGWMAPFVRARAAQNDLPYLGAQLKRGEPDASDYLPLAAGRSITARHRLEEAFDWSSTGATELTLHAHWRWHDVVLGLPPRDAASLPRPRSHHEGWNQDCGTVRVGL